VRIDLVHTDVQREDQLDEARVAAQFEELEARVVERMAGEGFTADKIDLTHFVDIRYGGQAYEIRIPLSGGTAKLRDGLARGITKFHVAHQDLYGYSYEGREPVELVNVGVTGLGLLKRPQIPIATSGGASADAALRTTSDVYFPQTQGKVACPVYERAKLLAGNTIEGPAIVEQYDSTTVVNPGWHGRLDEWGSLVLIKE